MGISWVPPQAVPSMVKPASGFNPATVSGNELAYSRCNPVGVGSNRLRPVDETTFPKSDPPHMTQFDIKRYLNLWANNLGLSQTFQNGGMTGNQQLT